MEAEAPSLRINGLLRAAMLAAETVDLHTNPRMTGALQQIRNAWEPMDQRGIPDGPAAAAQRYAHLRDACQLLDRQIGADQATGLLSGDKVQRARQQVWVLLTDTQAHVDRLHATADHPRPQPFTRRGPAEHASHAVATACKAWAATPLGRKAMDGELPDHADTIAQVRGAWQEIYDHGLTNAADAAPRFYRLAEGLHMLEEDVLSDGTTRGLWTKPLHEAADRALAVSQRLTATGDLHAWQGNRAQARRWERHSQPVLGLPTRLSDRASTLLGRIRRDGAATNGRPNDGAGRTRSTAQSPASTTAGPVARMLRWSHREGQTGR